MAANPSTPPSVTLLLLNLVVAALFLLSFFLSARFIKQRRQQFTQLGQVPPCPLLLSDVLLLAILLVATVTFKISPMLPIVAIAGAAILYQLRGCAAVTFWQLQPARIGDYAKRGLVFYLTIILPLMLIALLVLLVCQAFGWQFTQPQVELFLQLKSPGQIAWFIILAVVVAPLWEEIIFRGVLYPFLKKHLSWGLAMLCSSLLWAGIHLHLPVVLPFTFLGCALCFLYEQTGSLGYNIAVHSIFNLSNSLLLLFLKYYGAWQVY